MSNITSIDPNAEGRPAHIGEQEWALRVKLASAYRIFDHLGWTLVIYNHITARIPGTEHHFLINPFGRRYDEITASNLVKIDLDGNVLDGSDEGFILAGFIIHSAIHQSVSQAHWIMHTHTKEGIAVACKRLGLTNTNFYSAMLYDHLAYHDFEGVTKREDERERLAQSVGDKPVVILRNHGLLTHGRTVEEAFARMWILQLACETQLLSSSMTGDDIPISAKATEISTRDGQLFGIDDSDAYEKLYAALQRIVDSKDPGYRS